MLDHVLLVHHLSSFLSHPLSFSFCLCLALSVQPEELTDILEISNIVFTSMFVLEMVFKLVAFGVFGYIKNPYNIFDSIIVIIRYYTILLLQLVVLAVS